MEIDYAEVARAVGVGGLILSCCWVVYHYVARAWVVRVINKRILRNPRDRKTLAELKFEMLNRQNAQNFALGNPPDKRRQHDGRSNCGQIRPGEWYCTCSGPIPGCSVLLELKSQEETADKALEMTDRRGAIAAQKARRRSGN